MCDEAQGLLVAYLNALEEYDRFHITFLAAFHRRNEETVAAYSRLLGDSKTRIHTTRQQFQEHQDTHSCAGAIRFDGSEALGF